MNWFILLIAGLLEVGWAVGLNYSEGFTRFWLSVWTALSMLISIDLLGLAMRSRPVGTAYAVRVNIGAFGTAVMGVLLFGEPVNALRWLSLLLARRAQAVDALTVSAA